MAVTTILCLHGYAMNPAWLREWLLPIERALAGRATLVYPCAPIVAPPEEVRAMAQRFNALMPESRIVAGQNWCWYRASDDKPPLYLGLDETLSWLARYCQEQGGIDGVIGWSQGAVVASIMAAKMRHERQFDFRWAVICGGFLPGDRKIKALFEPPLPVPSLHVMGVKESEFMRERGALLRQAFAQSEWLDTPVGHVLPHKLPDYMAQIAQWIAQHLPGDVARPGTPV
jgi:hypothetical protein